jgi:hypothetical protein
MLNIYSLGPHSELMPPREPLVKASFVSVYRHMSPDEINNEVLAGRLRWVFNLAVNQAGALPDYRFWVREVTGDHVRHLTVEAVLGEILYWQVQFQPGQLCQLLSVSRASLLRLREQLGGRLKRGGAVYERAGVEQFLKGRLYNVRDYSSPARN